MRRETTAMITIAVCGDTHAHVVKATDSNGKPVSKIILIAHKVIYTASTDSSPSSIWTLFT